MSEKKTISVLNFFRKNLYYFMIGASLIIIATVIAVVLATGNGNTQSGIKESLPIIESEPDSTPESTPESNEPPKESTDDGSKPTDTKIVFTLPVSNSTVTKNYTSSTVVYNQTLGVYTGHMGIDFSAEAGTEVVSAYAGKIESVTSSYLNGTTVTIDHGNGLKSIYNSIDTIDNLKEGLFVSAGQVIGYVSDNNRQEYKDGPHLHFEVTLNGETVNPTDYLMMAEK